MAKAYEPDELAKRVFYLSMAGIGVYLVVVVLLIFAG